ncbi:hypothetical protein HRR83_003180 [Exophiala dermatitidis]|nr:hypothetical protein HRR74_004664 [Exophiala dermatitidis]KAJ4521267.1 hypothetical protein HRR73_003608 [Exophiala dermatitidis]KAJ4547859.1 hypothetical protein HRR76_000482 [Exophiala dermatitidis]KAJ4553798.1 hypothetical protein HRR77_002171 [Exophiala dermatitidis]KAJ4578126.1 hypothetical protein HRR79_001443 [Exophiala dermatitidis]
MIISTTKQQSQKLRLPFISIATSTTMGGTAFAPEGLDTPRMSPEVYNAILARIEALLRPHFRLVGHALEGPAKESHGDIDVLVAEPLASGGDATCNGHSATSAKTRRVTGAALASILGADHWKKNSGTNTFNLALKWPQELDSGVVSDKMSDNGDETKEGRNVNTQIPAETGGSSIDCNDQVMLAVADEGEQARVQNDVNGQRNGVGLVDGIATYPATAGRYIQVDITICPTEEYFKWHLFSYAHGDMWNILGGIIRRFGLTCTSKGLFMRIAEVESHNKEQSRVILTTDRTAVLNYLGLDVKRYWKPFANWDEMMAYAATCRFHDPGRWKERTTEKENKANTSSSEEVPLPDVAMTEKKVAGLKTGNPEVKCLQLKANDRQRGAKRPVFGYWITEYLPAHANDLPGRDAHLSRQEVVDDAKAYFGPAFAMRFDERKTKWTRLIKVDQLWADIRKSLPVQGAEIGYVMKGMKREIAGKEKGCPITTNEDGEAETVDSLMLRDLRVQDPAASALRIAFLEERFEDILEWAKTNWKEVAERQKRYEVEKNRAQQFEKRNKQAAANVLWAERPGSTLHEMLSAGTYGDWLRAQRMPPQGKEHHG